MGYKGDSHMDSDYLYPRECKMNKNVVVGLIVFLTSLMVVFIVGDLVKAKLVKEVIKELKNEYSPGQHLPQEKTPLPPSVPQKAIGLPEDDWNQMFEKTRL